MIDKENPEKKRFTTYLEMDTLAELIELHRSTRISITGIVQEAIDDVILKYKGKARYYEK